MSRKLSLIILAAIFLIYLIILGIDVLSFMPAKETAVVVEETVGREALLTGADDNSSIRRELLPDERININTATDTELERLPGIGPGLAEAILQYRRENGDFICIEDIMKVKGIGQGRFDDIAGNISVEENDNENSGS